MNDPRLIWITPDAEQLISDMARVSNPRNQGQPPGKLLAYCVRNQHWSIFEMASACIEIETTRDIARQILRHRSFSYQEFSQRYATVDALPDAPMREVRLQDHKNRQNSLETSDEALARWWKAEQENLIDQTEAVYHAALNRGIAKEVARSVLMEGLTTSRMYMTGTLRSWMHYCQLRTQPGTQKEHRDIALKISAILAAQFPQCWSALMGEQETVATPVPQVQTPKVPQVETSAPKTGRYSFRPKEINVPEYMKELLYEVYTLTTMTHRELAKKFKIPRSSVGRHLRAIAAERNSM